jgi:hypothetical protein
MLATIHQALHFNHRGNLFQHRANSSVNAQQTEKGTYRRTGATSECFLIDCFATVSRSMRRFARKRPHGGQIKFRNGAQANKSAMMATVMMRAMISSDM